MTDVVDEWLGKGPRSPFRPDPVRRINGEAAQLALFETNGSGGPVVTAAPRLPELEPVPEPPLHRVRSLSYSALALFEACSYRYYAERVAGMKPAPWERAPSDNGAPPGLHATEIGVEVNKKFKAFPLLISTEAVPELTHITKTADTWHLGAAATLTCIEEALAG